MNFSSETRVKDMALASSREASPGRGPGGLLLRGRKISPESLRYN
jgi:hypothetical protein